MILTSCITELLILWRIWEILGGSCFWEFSDTMLSSFKTQRKVMSPQYYALFIQLLGS